LDWYQRSIDRKAEELLDEHVSEISGNLIFTTPVTQLYQAAMTEYTRIDGEFVFEGVSYRMVKQRVQGNLLYVVCVKDDMTRIATDEINELMAAVAGQPSKDSASHGAKVINALLKYCDTTTLSGILTSSGWSRLVGFTYREDLYQYNRSYAAFHPPSFI
jgi:hypothetical protein